MQWHVKCFVYGIFRECKNRFLFTYLKSLIDCGVFSEIYLNFLPVGHTHCDGDQMYSRFSVFLKGNDSKFACIVEHNMTYTKC
jgi:hypothetical protein